MDREQEWVERTVVEARIGGESHPRGEATAAGIVERAHGQPLGLLVERDLTERVRSAGEVGGCDLVRPRHLGDRHVLEREVCVVGAAEHAVHAERRPGPGHMDVGRDLRRVAAVAQHLDIDLDRAGRHRRKEDRVGGHERELRPAERFLHGAQRGVHADTAEHVHHPPAVGDRGVVPTRRRSGRASGRCRRGDPFGRAGHRMEPRLPS